MNRSEPNIDELLNSFIDGELTASQQSEVERLIADDAQIARRLQQLQKTKMLVSSLPRAQAPGQITEQVKARSPARQLLAQQTVFSKREGARQLLVRRVLAAAAMIALVAISAGVIYTIVAPEAVSERPAERAVTVREMPSLAAEAGFSGRLELKTSALLAVDGFINRVIDENGLSDSVSSQRQPGQSLYSLTCSRQSLNLLLADLQSIWQKCDSARLFVDTEEFGEPVTIDAITAEQIAEIINQDGLERSIEVAKDFAVLNKMAELMPGKQIATAIDDKKVDLITLPKPVFTEYPRKTTKEPRQPKEVNLTL
ncbi:MAG: anti-sigma factor family protein, partial [Sedimentisphaerales bacterium]